MYGAGADDAAERICDRIASLGFANRGVKVRKDLAVLNSTHAPALLVECCFCDNDEDYALYNSDSMAYAIVKGITNQNIGGWKQDDKGWWYQNADGSYPVSQWMRLGAWYYFDDKGYAVQSDWKEVNGKKYYFDSNCYMVTGWRYINDKWYYFDGDGAMLTGKFEVDGYIYYADDNGAMQTGWKQIDSEWYYFNEDKNCQPNGSMLQNHWHNGYYLKDDGKTAHDEVLVIGGHKYTFGNDGKVAKTVLA